MGWKTPIDTYRVLNEFGNDALANLLYSQLVMRANHKDGFFTSKKGVTVALKRGQVVFGRRAYHDYLAQSTKDDGKKVERTLLKLQDFYQKVTLEVTRSEFTIVTLLDYVELTSLDPGSDPMMTHERPNDDPMMTTSLELKTLRVKNKRIKTVQPLQENPAEEVSSPYIELWERVMQTKIRTNVEKNLQAASKLSALLGDDVKLGEFLLFCRTTRQDKYAGQHLIIATANYSGILKNLETLEAKYAATKDTRSSFSEIITMSADERRFWGSPV